MFDVYGGTRDNPHGVHCVGQHRPCQTTQQCHQASRKRRTSRAGWQGIKYLGRQRSCSRAQRQPQPALPVHNILQEIGKNTVFVFSEAKSLFLFWKGSLEKFVSVDDLNKKLKQLENNYSEVKSIWKEMGDKAPENVKVIPDILDGEATYALEMLDEKGNPMKVYMTEDGVMMRLSNGELLDKPITAEEASQKIAQF